MSELAAFIVGIEHYDQPSWDVSGPCRNATRTAECLLEILDQPAGIEVFVNFSQTDAKPETDAKKEALERLKARGVVVHDHSFNRNTLDTAFRELRKRQGRLFFYWSGHGYADSAGKRILVCPDFRSDGFANRIFDATRRFEWLHSKEFSGLTEQILLMDVCAKSTKIKFEEDAVGNADRVLGTQQIGFYATQEGAYAYVGKDCFTDLLLADLRSAAAWPDLEACYESLKKRAFAAQCEPFILSGFARHEILPQTYAGNSKAGEARKATAGPIIANYVAACSALDGFVTPANQERILLVKGDAGFGKSLLVIERAKSFLKTVRYIGVKLTDRYDVADLLARVVTAVGQPMLPKFATGLRALGGPLQIQISTSFPFGWQDDVKRQLAAGNVGKVAELLECLFQDLSSLPEPLVFILDGFDATAPQMRALIEGQFLAGVARTPSVRAIVAGREIPDPNYAAWADCCAPVCNLTGVSKAEEWMPVVSRLGRRIDAEHPESYLAAICDVLKGQPSKIMEYIQGLPGEN